MKTLTQSIENALILTSSKPSDAELDEDMVRFNINLDFMMLIYLLWRLPDSLSENRTICVSVKMTIYTLLKIRLSLLL